MKIIIWCQPQQNSQMLISALNILFQKYRMLEILGVVYVSATRGGVLTLGGKTFPLIDKNSLPNIDCDIILVTEQDNSFGVVLEEARKLNIDTNKFILDRTVCTYGFSFEAYKKLSHQKLSIISMNVFGFMTGYTFGLPSVGVDISFSEKDFLKFLSDPIKYLRLGLRVEKTESNSKLFLGDIELGIPYGDIYLALATWNNWISNFNPFNLLVVMYTEKPEVLKEFDELPYAKKVCFVPFETNLESGYYVKPYYIGGRSFEAAVNKIATNQITCYNLWDILLQTKKTSVNLYSKALSKEIQPGKSISTEDGKFTLHNWWYTSDIDLSNFFFVKFIKNEVSEDKKFNFFSVFGDHRFVRTSKVENKIFFTGEDVFIRMEYDDYKDYCLDSVDLALGYEYIDNKKYLRFPLWILYVFYPKLDMGLIKNKISEINSSRSWRKYDCVLINSHDNMNTRTPIYEILKNVVQIKCAGSWNNNTDELKTVYNNDKRKYVHEFIFNICSENVNRFGYVTEKIFDAFIAGSIPIYYGSDNNPAEGIINKDAVLFFDPKSDNAALVKEVIRLKTDESYWEKFMRQEKLFSKNAAEYVYTTFEELAKRLKEM